MWASSVAKCMVYDWENSFRTKALFFLSCARAHAFKRWNPACLWDHKILENYSSNIQTYIYTHLTTNEKPFQSQRPCRKKKQPSLPASFYFSSQTDRLFMLLNYSQWGEWQNATNSHGREHTNADMNPKVTSLDGLSWSRSVDLKNEKLKNKPNKFPQIFKGSWKTWLAGIWRRYSAHITDQREDHISLTKSH